MSYGFCFYNFKGKIINPCKYPLNFSGYIFDHLPDNLRYINGSISIPNVVEHVDWDNNSVTWTEMKPIPPRNRLIFTYSAKAVRFGNGTNYTDSEGYYLINGEKIYVRNTNNNRIKTPILISISAQNGSFFLGA